MSNNSLLPPFLYEASVNVCFVGKEADVSMSLVVSCVILKTINGFVSAASVSPKSALFWGSRVFEL